jgi:Mg2+ and Co2+ transporter CorA
MHLHIVPKLNKQSIAIQHALQDCEEKLSSLMLTVHKQRWQQLTQDIKSYEDSISLLKSSMQNQSELPSALLHQFQYLSAQQRRIMRTIHQHMQQTADDLKSIDQGISKLQQTAQLQTSQALCNPN